MAITILCGFESRADVQTDTMTTAVARTPGGTSLRLGSVIGSNSGFIPDWQTGGGKRLAGGTVANVCQSFRFYVRVDVLPSVTGILAASWNQLGAAAKQTKVTLSSAGTLVISDGSGAASATAVAALTADANWHRIDVDANGTTRSLYVDGVLLAQSVGGTAAGPDTAFQFGNGGNGTADLYFDDIALDDGSIGAPAAVANNRIVLLIPTAGTNAGSWTDGAGGTGDIHGSVDNIPPVGAAAATAGAKIKNAASGTALDYVATMQTYLVGGLPPGSIVNAVQAICNDGEEVATGTKSGAVWVASNPAQSAVTIGAGVGFDFGDDIGLLGTFPSNWSPHYGVVAVAPSVTLGTAPTMTIRKGSSTVRVVDVDLLGIYVDYTPPPIAKSLQLNQSVNRASSW